MILNTMKCNICVNLFIEKYGTAQFMLQFRATRKKSQNGNVLWQFLTIVLAVHTRKAIQRILNHSFRTFFPLKTVNCFCLDIWQREKCEFDMILIFKLHILLLFIFTHRTSQKGTILLSGRTQSTQCIDPGGTEV